MANPARKTSSSSDSATSAEGTSMDYLEALSQGSGRDYVTFTGVTVQRPASGLFGIKGCTPILFCLCVHSSPDNPCPCDGPVAWIPDASIIHKQTTRRFAKILGERRALVELQVKPELRIFVDTTIKLPDRGPLRRLVVMRAEDGELKTVEGDVWVREMRPVRADILAGLLTLIATDERLGTIAKDAKGKSVLGAIIEAFSFGWAIGTAIEEEFDLSDAISDWAIDFFGPWPF